MAYSKFIIHSGNDTYKAVLCGNELFDFRSDRYEKLYAFKYSLGGSVTLDNGVKVTVTPIVDGDGNCDFTLSNGNGSFSYFLVHRDSHGSQTYWKQESGYGTCYDYDANAEHTYYLDEIRIYMVNSGDDIYSAQIAGYDEEQVSVSSSVTHIVDFVYNSSDDSWYYYDYS